MKQDQDLQALVTFDQLPDVWPGSLCPPCVRSMACHKAPYGGVCSKASFLNL
jgi:hypothetical protein